MLVSALVLAALLPGHARGDEPPTSDAPVAEPAGTTRPSEPIAGPTSEERHKLLLPPLYWFESHGAQSTRIVFPFWTRVTDESGSTDAFLPPLLWRFRDDAKDASTWLLFPLALVHRAPSEGGAIVGPFYGYRDDKGWAGGLFPLLLVGDHGGRSHQALLPVFLHAHDDERKTDTLAVTLAFLRRTPTGFDAGLFPLLFAGRHDDERYVSALGLYHYRADQHGFLHVLGPLYAGVSDEGYRVGLAPLFHAGRTGGRHLRWLLPPLYLHFDDEPQRKQLTLIGPLFKVRSGDAVTQGLFPLLWGVDRGTGADHRHYDVALPLFAHAHDDARRTDTLWLGPYIRRRDEAHDKTTHVLLPLGVKHDEPGYHALVQFPFFWKIEDGDAKALAVFPLFLHVRRPDLDVDVGFPLVWRWRNQTATSTVIATAFWRRAKDRVDGGVLPLFGFGHTTSGPSRKYSWSLPLLYWHSSDEAAGTSRTIFTLFLWDKTPTAWTSSLFPLWVGWRRGPQERIVGPGFFHGEDDDKGKALTVVGPVYFGHDTERKRLGLFPLLFTSWGAKADDPTWNATLFPLFHFGKKRDGSRLVTLLGGYTTYDGGWKAFLGPFYGRHDRAGFSAALIPLFYHATDGEGPAATSTTLLFPLVLHRSTPETSLTAVTPLFWHYKTITSTTTVGFPLFFDQHYLYDSRTTGVVPFFFHQVNYATGQSHTVIPPLLFWLHTQPEGNDFAVFPILWRIVAAGGDRRVTLALPLFFDFRLGEAHTQVLAPLYTRLERPNYNLTVVLNSYYLRGKGPDEGTYTVRVLPFFSFARPHPGDLEWRVLEGLVGYSRIGKARSVKILWAVDVALEPAGMAPATTFFGPTPSSERRSLE